MGKLARELFNEKCSVCSTKLGLTKESYVNKKKHYCQKCYDERVESGEIIPPFHYKKPVKE